MAVPAPPAGRFDQQRHAPGGGGRHPRRGGLPRGHRPLHPCWLKGLARQPQRIWNARDSLDGTPSIDQGITTIDGNANVVPTDGDAIAYSRSAGQVLNVVHLNPAKTDKGGFFPDGVHGEINTSDDNA